jgi:hypothetical protein
MVAGESTVLGAWFLSSRLGCCLRAARFQSGGTSLHTLLAGWTHENFLKIVSAARLLFFTLEGTTYFIVDYATPIVPSYPHASFSLDVLKPSHDYVQS